MNIILNNKIVYNDMKMFSATIMKVYNDQNRTQDTRYMIEMDRLKSINLILHPVANQIRV